MAEQKWNPKMVANRMEEAASTLRRLPSVKPKGHASSWPPVIQELMDICRGDAHLRLGPPPADAITRMDECLEWLKWLESNQVHLVWLHAERVPRKVILGKLGVSRVTAWRLWAAALTIIATRLNLSGEKVVETSC